MKFLTVCALAIGAVALILIIKQFRSEISLSITLCLSVLLMSSAMGLLHELFVWLEGLWNGEYLLYYKTMLKALGISLVGSLASGICRDAGQTSVAGSVEFVVKCEILCLALPILQDLVRTALSLSEL